MRKNVKICATTLSSESGFAFSLKMKQCFALEFWRKAIIFGHKNTTKNSRNLQKRPKIRFTFCTSSSTCWILEILITCVTLESRYRIIGSSINWKTTYKQAFESPKAYLNNLQYTLFLHRFPNFPCWESISENYWFAQVMLWFGS